MEQALISIKSIHEWVKRTLYENNREKLDQLYAKLNTQLNTIFNTWLNLDQPEIYYQVISLLLPTSSNNLFTAL